MHCRGADLFSCLLFSSVLSHGFFGKTQVYFKASATTTKTKSLFSHHNSTSLSIMVLALLRCFLFCHILFSFMLSYGFPGKSRHIPSLLQVCYTDQVQHASPPLCTARSWHSKRAFSFRTQNLTAAFGNNASQSPKTKIKSLCFHHNLGAVWFVTFCSYSCSNSGP